MALTIKQVFNIQRGIIRPESMQLFEMVAIQAKKHAQYFIDNQKETDENTLADSYKSKILGLCNTVKGQDNFIFHSFVENMALHWMSFLTYSNVKAWEDSDWEINISNSISEIFDKVSNVTQAEKLAYEGLYTPFK